MGFILYVHSALNFSLTLDLVIFIQILKAIWSRSVLYWAKCRIKSILVLKSFQPERNLSMDQSSARPYERQVGVSIPD